MRIEIGMTVQFIVLNATHQGLVTNISGEVAYVAVLGYSETFPVAIGSVLPVVKE